MSRFGEILGHENALDLLNRMVEQDRVPQALLFHGPESVGKATVARAFSATLLCEAVGRRPCGGCTSCKLLDHGAHPDLLLIERQPKPDAGSRASGPEDLRKQILIDQIRELARLAAVTPRRGRRRLFLIDPADRMNLEAQNALLKTLEEPPGHATLILIASRPHLLLPTVRSRCFTVGFSALRGTVLSGLLATRGIERSQATARAALSEGRVGRALTLDLDALTERREGIVRVVEELSAGGAAVGKLPRLAADLAGRDETHLVESLDLLQGLLRDAARCGAERDRGALLHTDLEERLERLAGRLGSGRPAALVASIDRLRHGLRHNTNRTLVAEALLAALAGGPVP